MSLAAAITGEPGAAQRRGMAKAITLLESTRADHRAQADELLTAVPEPASWLLLLAGSALFGIRRCGR